MLRKNLKSGIKVAKTWFGKKYPIKVNYVTTYLCNFKCKYCNVKALSEKEMDTSKALKMIDALHKLGMEQITFIGGEPLLREDIGKLGLVLGEVREIWTTFLQKYLLLKPF